MLLQSPRRLAKQLGHPPPLVSLAPRLLDGAVFIALGASYVPAPNVLIFFIDVSGLCNRPQRMHCKQGWCRCLAVVQLTSDAYQRMKSANRALNTPITTSSCICGVPMRTGCCTGGAATTVTDNPRRARCAALRFAAVTSPDSAPAPGQPPSDHGLRCGPGRLFFIAACGLHQPARRTRATFERF